MRHRLALATAGATLVLILFGGLVTNTGSALAVPDWPTTFGHAMFTYPWAGMVGGVFYEHSHRLIGSLVGGLTLALAAALWRAGGRLRALGLVAVAAVIAQGVVGGMRVLLLEPTLGIVHGCLAQGFFALLAAIALLTSPRAALPPTVEPAVRPLALLAVGVVSVQIVFGALLTHAGYLEPHLVGALAVFALVPLVTARLRRSRDAVAAPAARAVLVLLAVQLLLGIGALLGRVAPEVMGSDGGRLALAVAHRLTGSLILAGSVIMALRTLGAVGHPATVADAAEQPA